MAVAKEPTVITTHGLGSCLAIILYDPAVKVGGLAHIMLPTADLVRKPDNPAKFPATALKSMLEEMDKLGCQRSRVICKLVGGARMFSALLATSKGSNTSNIGQRNTVEAKSALAALNIPIVAEDTGADYGRSVEFVVSSGTVLVHSFKAGIREL
jgi:chemotaxis protein CheD